MAEELVIPVGTDINTDQPILVDVPPPETPAELGEVVDADFTVAADGSPDPATEEPSDEPSDEQVLLEEIQMQEQRVRERKAAWEEHKEDTKKAKDRFDAAVDDLCNMIRQSRASDQPLLNGVPPMVPASPPPPKEPAKPEADESWRIVRLEDVFSGLPKSVPAACEEACLTTVGELAAYTESGKLLTDIPGIGPAKAEKIEQALEEFWARRKEYETPLDIADDGTATAEAAMGPTEDAQEEEAAHDDAR